MVAKVSAYSEYENPLFRKKNEARRFMDASGSHSPPLHVTAAVNSKVSLSMISFNPWPGDYNFQIKCQEPSDRCPSHARSDLLQKIFVQKDNPLVIEASIDKGNKYEDFIVRAAAVYSRPSEVHEPVKRCLNHSTKDKYTSKGSHEHFIWSDYPKSVYEEDSHTGRLSVLTPLFQPQPGSSETLLVYRFMCLNSCISRRPIRIVFSLERNNTVVGSHSIDVRVCACPARDLAIEEKRHRLKRSKREEVQRSSPLRGGSPSSSDESLSSISSKKRRRNEVEDDEDEIQMLPVKGKKMAKIMKFLLERLMFAEKCLEIYPELMDVVRQETEELAQLNPSAQKKKVTASSGPAKLSAKLANIQAVMSEPLMQITNAANITSNIQPVKPAVTVQSLQLPVRTNSSFTATVNSEPTITMSATPSVSVQSNSQTVYYEIPTTSVALATSMQPSVSIIPQISIKEEPI